MVTCGSEEEALEISNLLVRKRIAACVNIIAARSIFDWRGEMADQKEWLLLIKSQRNRFDELKGMVKSVHSYELPEIIALDISAASTDYANWIINCTAK